METLKQILTGVYIEWPMALLQMILYVLILFAVAVWSWWVAIVITDLKKKLRLKTGKKNG